MNSGVVGDPKWIPLAVPNLCGKEADYLLECVETNFVSSVGPFVVRFEDSVSSLAGAKGAVATSSGTSALHLALTVSGVIPGDLVLIPSLTFIATANAVSQCGAIPWLIDVDSASWTINPELLRELLETEAIQTDAGLMQRSTGRRISAIVPVYTLGLPADMDAINQLASDYGLAVIADAAAALGATYRGRKIGEATDLSVLSFNGNKTFTCGGGGALIGNTTKLLEAARHLSTTARVGPSYEHDKIGYNYRLTNLQAGVGCAQLELATTFIDRKRQIDSTYREFASEQKLIGEFPSPTWARSACWFSGVVLDPQLDPDLVIAQLKGHGIEARTFWKPMHLQLPYQFNPQTSMPVTDSIWRRVLTLPSSTSISDADLNYVCAILADVLKAT